MYLHKPELTSLLQAGAMKCIPLIMLSLSGPESWKRIHDYQLTSMTQTIWNIMKKSLKDWMKGLQACSPPPQDGSSEWTELSLSSCGCYQGTPESGDMASSKSPGSFKSLDCSVSNSKTSVKTSSSFLLHVS